MILDILPTMRDLADARAQLMQRDEGVTGHVATFGLKSVISRSKNMMKHVTHSLAGNSEGETDAANAGPSIVSLSAVTLATRDMAHAVRFYEALGFPCKYGGPSEAFTSFAFGGTFLNLIADPRGPAGWWGRVIVYVSDVDGIYRKALAAGIKPEFAPLDAPWGERYFHVVDPDGHEISFAKPLV